MTRRLSYTANAGNDLIDIATHVADMAQDDAAGEDAVDRLDRKCQALAVLPGLLGRPRPEVGEGLRSFPFRGYVIFFRYRGDLFEVVSILDGRRDIESAFAGD